MSAAIGTVQLLRLDEMLAKRAQVARWYSERLNGHHELIEVPVVAASTTRMSWFVYVIRLAPRIDRGTLMGELDERGIPSRPYFTPIHLQPFYRDRFEFKPGDFPVSEDLGRRSLALPFSSVMTQEQVDYVCRNLVGCAESQCALS